MNFKLNKCQHSNCFKTKVQLNKCEIHMDVIFTFHSPEGTTVVFGLFFWVTGQFADKPTRSQSIDGLVNLWTSEVAEMAAAQG